VEVSKDDLLRAWRTNGAINRTLIDAIDDGGMAATLSKRGGRDVCRQFAHLHNVRVWQLEAKAKPLAEGLKVFGTDERPDRKHLLAALDASGAAVERQLAGMVADTPKLRGFKRGAVQTLAYYIAHESHHRGNILLTLKQCGHKLDRSLLLAIWDWDRI